MLAAQGAVAGSTIGAAAVVVAQSAVNDGITAETGWSAGMIAGGVAVFIFLDRRAASKEAAANELRRQDDERASKRISDLEAEVRRLNDRIIEILTQQKDP